MSVHHSVQNGSGARSASYPMGKRGSFPLRKAAEAWSLQLTSILCRGQRMHGSIPHLSQYAFMAWCSVKAQGQLYLYLLHNDNNGSATSVNHRNWSGGNVTSKSLTTYGL